MTVPAEPHRVVIAGAAGRMGQRLLRRLAERSDLRLGAALGRSDRALGGGARLERDAAAALATGDVVIDFTAPAACLELLPLAAARGLAYVLASTGLEPAHETAVAAAAARIPVLVASNTSVGVNVLATLVELAAARLGPGYDVEIGEIHHRLKKDAPSGTAKTLAEAARRGRPELKTVLGRAGTGPARPKDELGIAALRGGDVPGEHTVYFFGDGERLELTHRAGSPDIFADGALRAAAWLVGKPAGRYRMADVLGA